MQTYMTQSFNIHYDNVWSKKVMWEWLNFLEKNLHLYPDQVKYVHI